MEFQQDRIGQPKLTGTCIRNCFTEVLPVKTTKKMWFSGISE